MNVGGNPGDLQAAVNAAINGDGTHKNNTLEVPAGPTYNPLVLPFATTGWTRIISDSGSLPAAGVKVTAAHADALFKIRSPNTGDVNARALRSLDGQGWQIIGADISTLDPGPTGEVIRLEGDRIIFDRSLVRGHANGVETSKGIRVFGTDFRFENGSVLDIKSIETQAIGIYPDRFQPLGLRCYHVENSDVQATAMNILIADQFSGVRAENVTILRCDFTKPIAWQPTLQDGSPNPAYGGIRYHLRHLLEVKWAKNVRIEGCRFSNCWIGDGGANGDAFLVYSGLGLGPAYETSDVLLQHNTFDNCKIMFAISLPGGGGDRHCAKRIAIVNNLGRGITARMLKINWESSDVRVDHNTGVPMQSGGDASDAIQISHGANTHVNLTIRRNIIGKNQYGILREQFAGFAGEITTADANTYFPSRVWAENALYGNATYGAPQTLAGFTPFATAAAAKVNPTTGVLDSDSSLRAGGADGGSDGKDLGVDHVALNDAISGAPSAPIADFDVAQAPTPALTMQFTDTSR